MMVFLDKNHQDKNNSMQKVETFGEKVRSLREHDEMPLRKLAALLDIDQSTLSKIERNERKPNDEIIQKIAEIFKIDKEELNISFLSDMVAYELLEEEHSKDILKIAEQKIKYFKKTKTFIHA
jgi:transcriptional regulator with XRE-family HTH domain